MLKKEFKNALIIINPVSGKGDPKERIREIKAVASELGWQGELVQTSKKIRAEQIASKAIKKDIKHIIVCGGDGTIMEAIGAVVDKNVSIGVVPLGTGNLLAQNLNISTDLKESVKTAFLGKVKKIDVGKANDTYFTIMAGMGLDADMLRDADQNLKNKVGVLAYIISVIKNIFKPPGSYKVSIDNQKPETYRAKSVMVANMSQITGGIKIAPKANPQSSILQVGIIKASDWKSWLSILFSTMKGRIDRSPHYILKEGKHVEITTIGKSRMYECDGNEFPPVNHLKIDIYPSILTILVP